jgi:hypothetical protein
MILKKSKVFTATILSLVVVSSAYARQAGGPGCSVMDSGSADGVPRTFEQLVQTATAIVEGTVQSVERAPRGTRGVVRDQILLTTTRVLKGSGITGLVGVSTGRSTGYFSMEPGERYIVFLTGDGLTRYPNRPDVPLYSSIPTATLCVNAGKVWVSGMGNRLREMFNALELEKAAAEILAYVRSRPAL